MTPGAGLAGVGVVLVASGTGVASAAVGSTAAVGRLRLMWSSLSTNVLMIHIVAPAERSAGRQALVGLV